jgi:hypothetical protein
MGGHSECCGEIIISYKKYGVSVGNDCEVFGAGLATAVSDHLDLQSQIPQQLGPGQVD